MRKTVTAINPSIIKLNTTLSKLNSDKLTKDLESVLSNANQTSLNLKEVCRFSCSYYSTVKRVYDDIKWNEKAELHTFPHQKLFSQVMELETIIDNLEGTYHIVSDLKRKHPEFSTKWILDRLHKEGFK